MKDMAVPKSLSLTVLFQSRSRGGRCWRETIGFGGLQEILENAIAVFFDVGYGFFNGIGGYSPYQNQLGFRLNSILFENKEWPSTLLHGYFSALRTALFFRIITIIKRSRKHPLNQSTIHSDHLTYTSTPIWREVIYESQNIPQNTYCLRMNE